MTPWWLRPSADGIAEDEVEPDGGAVPPEAADAAAATKEPAEAAPPPVAAPAAPDGRKESQPARGARRRSRRGEGREERPAAKPASRPRAPEPGSGREAVTKPAARGRAAERVEERPGRSAAEEVQILYTPSEGARQVSHERRIAVFCDLENVALGVRDSEIQKFDITLVLERLLEKGKIIVKKAYADWERYSEFKRTFHEAGIELIDIPQKYYSGKNSADIKMAVDALEMCYSKEHLDTFVVLSGDSDFSPLVSKLKENNKHVIGVGVQNSSSRILIDNCDEFLFYEDIWRDTQRAPSVGGLDKKTAEAFRLMVDVIKALMRENKDVLWGSMIKQTMQRKRPSFNEGTYGYSTFSEMLEDAERRKVIRLKRDQRSGSYIVIGFAHS